ncbi:DUF4240 domain-containing protein [Erysipelothrix rhusiopathiae]|uniref:DUF4240 domain-containing protein n=1 Tax=Erysipelothrix rhusiopathiae TaxID=1648 RepID=UPI0023AEB8FD|nr:DUF4240 domain-containing protein [Erysipelothrix rhusiopathiae]
MNQVNFWSIIDTIRQQSQKDDALFYFLFEKATQKMPATDYQGFTDYFYTYVRILEKSLWPTLVCSIVNDSTEQAMLDGFYAWTISQGYGFYKLILAAPDETYTKTQEMGMGKASMPQLYDVIGTNQMIDLCVDDLDYYHHEPWGGYETLENAFNDINIILPQTCHHRSFQNNFNHSKETVKKVLNDWNVNLKIMDEFPNIEKEETLNPHIRSEYYDLNEPISENIELLTATHSYLFYCAVDLQKHRTRLVRFDFKTGTKNDIFSSQKIAKIKYLDAVDYRCVFRVDYGYENSHGDDCYLVYRIDSNTIDYVSPYLDGCLELLDQAILHNHSLYFSGQIDSVSCPNIYRFNLLTRSTFKVVSGAGMMRRFGDNFLFGYCSKMNRTNCFKGVFEYQLDDQHLLKHDANIYYNIASVNDTEWLLGMREGISVWLNQYKVFNQQTFPSQYEDLFPIAHNEAIIVGYKKTRKGLRMVLIDRKSNRMYELEKGVVCRLIEDGLEWVTIDALSGVIKVNEFRV